jgi:hypothetical protein
MTILRRTAGCAQSIIDDLDERRRPAQVLGGGAEALLARRALAMLQHLGQRRLADRHQGLAAEVMRLDVRLMGCRHAQASRGWCAWRAMVAIKRTTATAASAAKGGRSGSAACRSRSQADVFPCEGLVERRPQASRPSGTRRRPSTRAAAPSPEERTASRRVSEAAPSSHLALRLTVGVFTMSWLFFGAPRPSPRSEDGP